MIDPYPLMFSHVKTKESDHFRKEIPEHYQGENPYVFKKKEENEKPFEGRNFFNEEFNFHNPTPFGLKRSASQEEIKKKYRELILKFHPDKPEGDEEKFKSIQQQWEEYQLYQ